MGRTQGRDAPKASTTSLAAFSVLISRRWKIGLILVVMGWCKQLLTTSLMALGSSVGDHNLPCSKGGKAAIATTSVLKSLPPPCSWSARSDSPGADGLIAVGRTAHLSTGSGPDGLNAAASLVHRSDQRAASPQSRSCRVSAWSGSPSPPGSTSQCSYRYLLTDYLNKVTDARQEGSESFRSFLRSLPADFSPLEDRIDFGGQKLLAPANDHQPNGIEAPKSPSSASGGLLGGLKCTYLDLFFEIFPEYLGRRCKAQSQRLCQVEAANFFV